MTAVLLLALAAAPAADPAAPEGRAKAFVTLLEAGKFTAAAKEFDEAMAKALPGDALAELWKRVTTQVGALEKQLAARSEPAPPYTIAYVTCKFTRATLDVKVVYDGQNRVAGLNFLPVHDKDRFPPPAYAKPDTFTETPVKVGAGEWLLPGTLTLPKGPGPFPAAVLVHGSGPQDRDETVGRLKPFRDLAHGLATRGVAVLRYEKRTKEHPLKIATAATFTVQEETVDDALAAVKVLRQTAGIDPKRVYVIGHSQGAMMAPRILSADRDLAGAVMMAAPSRPLEELMLEQTTAALAKRDKRSAVEVQVLEALQKVARLAKAGKLTPDTPPADLMGLKPTYWLSLCGYTVVPEALKLDRPLLVLQGEKDVQVTMTDFAGWRAALAARPRSVLKSYAGLGHLFTPSDGQGDPLEVARPANVPEAVVKDIAEWVRKP